MTKLLNQKILLSFNPKPYFTHWAHEFFKPRSITINTPNTNGYTNHYTVTFRRTSSRVSGFYHYIYVTCSTPAPMYLELSNVYKFHIEGDFKCQS